MPNDSAIPLRCIVLPIKAEYSLLLPNISLVEIIEGVDLDIVVDPQGGLIGKVQWHGWHVPLLSFDAASYGTIPKFNMETKTVVIHSLSTDSRMPYLGLIVQGAPKRIVINDDQLKPCKKTIESDLVEMMAKFENQTLVVPCLAALVAYVNNKLS